MRASVRLTMASRIRSTSMFEIYTAYAAAAIAFILALVALRGVAVSKRQLGQAQRSADELAQQLEFIRQSISGLTAGAVGMDRRVGRLEAQERALTERQESLEIQQVDEQPYGHAIRLVQQGAGVNRLVQELDLSESEADLIVRLHGQRDSA